jgi:hypothetical protein
MKFIFGFLLIIGVLVIVPAVDFAFAAGDEPGKYLDRRVVIWNLFYKMMTVAFTVGSVVSGTIIWILIDNWSFTYTSSRRFCICSR